MLWLLRLTGTPEGHLHALCELLKKLINGSPTSPVAVATTSLTITHINPRASVLLNEQKGGHATLSYYYRPFPGPLGVYGG